MTGAPAEVGFRDVPPDPSIADAVGRHHSLATALADLIDNSVDAGATRVLVRFLSEAGVVHGLRVIDDGRGMNAETIDAAMTFARRREYAQDDLGHFGLGLKAASLSQADELDVLSRAMGHAPVGRRLRSTAATRVIELEQTAVLDAMESAIASLGRSESPAGTIVEWRHVRGFLSSPSAEERTAWLDSTVESLRAHLGVVFHRLLAQSKLSLVIDDFDTAVQLAGAPRVVQPIDPFGFRPGGSVTELELDARLAGLRIPMRAVIWPPSQQYAAEFRLRGRPGGESQGFYVYRRDRLLQAGGWNGLVHGSVDLSLARIAVELDDDFGRHVTINPEKSGVELDADAREAIEHAEGAGVRFRDFIQTAERTASEARRRTRRPVTLVTPRRGFSPRMLEAIEETVSPAPVDPIEIRWRSSILDDLVEVDLEHRTLWLNSRYRRLLSAGTGQADDAPLLKTLLLLLYSRFFEGTILGAREKEELAAWNELLSSALGEEIEQHQDEGAADVQR